MQFSLVKLIPSHEKNEILGSYFFENFRKTIAQEKPEFLQTCTNYLQNLPQENSLRQSLDMLCELTSLSFILYKWSVLLVNLKAGIYADLILTIKLKNNNFFIKDKSFEILSVDLSEQIPYKSYEKSRIFSLLVFLYTQDLSLEILELDAINKAFFGSYLSFNEIYAKENQSYIRYIDIEFQTFYKRFTELKSLFVTYFKG